MGHPIPKDQKVYFLLRSQPSAESMVLNCTLLAAGDYNLSNNNVTDDEILFEKAKTFLVFPLFFLSDTTKFFSLENIREQNRMGRGCSINNRMPPIMTTAEK